MSGDAQTRRDTPRGSFERAVARSFWLVPLAFYGSTVTPGVTWIDGPMIAWHVQSVRLDTWVNTHNLFHILGWIWSALLPVSDMHYGLNLLCAVFGAATVHLIVLCALELTRNPIAAMFGGVAVMFGHSLWWHSTVLEVYTLNTALMTALLFCVVRYDRTRQLPYLYALSFLFALSLTNHVIMGMLLAAVCSIFVWPETFRRIRQPKVLALLAFFFLAGSQIYISAFTDTWSATALQHRATTAGEKLALLPELIDNATGGHFKESMFPDMPAARKWNWRLNYLFLLLMNYPSAAFVLGWLGIFALWRLKRFRRTLVFFALAIGAQAAFSINYVIWDMYAFGLPVWVLFGFLVPLGADFVWRRGKLARRALIAAAPTLLLGPWLYAQIPVWAQSPGWWQRYFITFDYVSNVWDPAEYFANPNKRHYDLPQRMAEALFEKLPQRTHMLDSDGKGHYPFGFYYQNVLGRRPDIRYHAIFGPTFDRRQAQGHARALIQALERNEPVYLSSLKMPERFVINEMYLMLRTDTRKHPSPQGRHIEWIERKFPKYQFRRFYPLPGEPVYMYSMEKRSE